MDTADEDVAQEQRIIADAQFHRTRRAAPDGKRCTAQEDIEAGIAQVEADGKANPLVTPTQTSKPRKVNRGSLPKHLPRIEEVVEPENTICGCGHERHVIGEDVSERLSASRLPAL